MATSAEKIVLGSGYLYCLEFNSGTGIPEDSVIETESNILGYIKGGATVEYTPTKYTAIDDMGRKSKTITTDEEAHLKSGVMTWNGNTLGEFVTTSELGYAVEAYINGEEGIASLTQALTGTFVSVREYGNNITLTASSQMFVQAEDSDGY